jgi:hypothetical protein
MKKYIAYMGRLYTIEWYFDQRDKSKARDYYNDLSDDRKRKAMALFKLMAEHGSIMNRTKFVNEDDGIYAFKPQPDRFLCFFFTGKKIIITNAFFKNVQKMPPQEKERALRAFKDYELRIKNGTYYEE